jgi:hypothetical protein
MLAHLHRLAPDLVVIREGRTRDFRYRVKKGPVWLAIEKAGRKKQTVGLGSDGDG